MLMRQDRCTRSQSMTIGVQMSKKPTRSPDGRMTLIEHLTELRTRIIRSLIAIALGAVVAWFLYPHIFNLLIHPYRQVIGDSSITGGRPLHAHHHQGRALPVRST